MTDHRQIQAFNQQLDDLLSGAEPDLSTLTEDDRQAIRIAARLVDIDLSPQSTQRYNVRRKLLQDQRLRPKITAGMARCLSIRPSAALLIAFPSATLLFVLVFVLGWTFTNLGRQSGSSDPVAATAFAISGTSAESGLPPSVNRPSPQAFAPQPLPTPIAPRQSITYTPATLGPIRTLPINSQQTGPAGDVQASP
jgi:hypothetical protein